MSLLAGVLTVSVAEAPAGATTTKTPVSMTMTAGTFATQHGTPGAVPVITTPVFTGKETATTGSFSTATFKFPTQHNATTPTVTGHTKSAETILVYTAPSTTVSASINTSGTLSIGATLVYEVKITYPLSLTCTTVSPVHVVLSSTAPYTAAAKTVTVKNATIDVPSFSGCLAGSNLTSTFSGPGGELGLTLHGTLTVPSSGTPSKTIISATPASPQLVGTTVALKATVKKTTGSPATKASGSMTFRNGTTTLGTASVVGGTATLHTKALPLGTDSVTAAFGGGGGYAASTSAPITYAVKAAPTVQVTGLPKVAPGKSPTTYPFTVTITNPSNGVTFPKLYLQITVNGLNGANRHLVHLQYQNATGTWCTPITFGALPNLHGYYVTGITTCTFATTAYPLSFSSTPGTPIVAHFRVSFPTVSGYDIYGAAIFKFSLFTGYLTGTTSTTATPYPSAPLDGSAAPHGSAQIAVYPATPLGSKVSTAATRPVGPTYPVRQGFSVGLRSTVKATPSTSNAASRTGTVSYTIDGTPVATSTTLSAGETKIVLHNTAGLSAGTSHTLVATYTPATYTGHAIYGPSSLTETFTVVTPPSGTAFTCTFGSGLYSYGTIPAYATATGTVPTAALPTSTVTATNVAVTLTIDPVVNSSYYNTNQGFTFHFSPTGTPATSGKITFTGAGTHTKATAITGSAHGLSTKVVVKKGSTPGTTVAIGVKVFTSHLSLIPGTLTCRPATGSSPAPIGTTEVAGTTLSASPSSPVTQGTPVTLTAAVYPQPATGGTSSQVQFFDNGKSVGTALVSTTGSSRGTATLTLSTLAAGAHSFTATWTGAPSTSVPFNVSNTVPFTVNPTPVTAPVVTTQPQSAGVKAGQTATFTAAASGSSPSVQWQVSTDGGKTWTNVSGATADAYSLTATKGNNANQYRAVFTNGAGTATSNAATLDVTATGYWLTASNGAVYAYGNLPFYGSAGNLALNKPIVGSAATPTGGGYWLVASDGGIFAYGAAQFYGSMGGKALNAPIVGMAPTPTGKGYWEVASDGGIFAFGAAQFSGSMGGKPLNQPVVGIAATPTGKGYWEVASDGGIFAFGAATFHGSTGSMTLAKPITAMSTTPTGGGYWLVASDGGIFAFGSAQFYGTVAGTATSPVVGMEPATDGGGYLEVEANGRVVQFGDAPLAGTALTQTLSGASIVGITS